MRRTFKEARRQGVVGDSINELMGEWTADDDAREAAIATLPDLEDQRAAELFETPSLATDWGICRQVRRYLLHQPAGKELWCDWCRRRGLLPSPWGWHRKYKEQQQKG